MSLELYYLDGLIMKKMTGIGFDRRSRKEYGFFLLQAKEYLYL